MIQKRQNTPAIAITIPLYNKGKYVARALNSIFAQTYQNFEIVVVDDGSTDRGPDIVSRFTDPRMRLIRQANAGPGAARNRGIRESTAPLLAFLDADDEWMPEFLEESVQRLHAHPDCVLSIAGQYRTTDRISWEQYFRSFGINEGPWRMPMDMEPHLIKPALDFFHCGAILCWRKALEGLGGFYAKYRCTYGEDLYLWLQVALNYKVYRDPAPLMWYHTEASELGVGRKIVYPTVPILTEPEPIRNNCRLEYSKLLERCLAFYALRDARRCARAGDHIAAQHLLRYYPLAQTFNWHYGEVQLYILLATLPRLRHWIHEAKSLMPFL